MDKLTSCPACGAPLPLQRTPRGVTCEFCATFIKASLIRDELLPEETSAAASTPVFTPPPPPEFRPSSAASDFEHLKLPSGWHNFRIPAIGRIRRTILGVIVLVIALLCLSCVCLIAILNEPVQRWLNSLMG
ncbi:MAG: hypothetical protein AB1453_07670 [Chloroflexota bacterium]